MVLVCTARAMPALNKSPLDCEWKTRDPKERQQGRKAVNQSMHQRGCLAWLGLAWLGLVWCCLTIRSHGNVTRAADGPRACDPTGAGAQARAGEVEPAKRGRALPSTGPSAAVSVGLRQPR